MAETKTQLILAQRLGYVNDAISQVYLDRLTELGKMLHGYINHLRGQKNIVREQPTLDELYDV